MLITPEYKATLSEMHTQDPSWGEGHRWFAKAALEAVVAVRPKTILDYGAGKQALKQTIPELICYDPGVESISALPEPADLVLSCCVLEHVEPECLDNVLDHIKSLTKRYVLIAVSCFQSNLKLPDGRNAHLIVQDVDWWAEKLMSRFYINYVAKVSHDPCRRMVFYGRPKP